MTDLQPVHTVPHVGVGVIGAHGGRVVVAVSEGADRASLIIQEPARAGTLQLTRAQAMDLAQMLIQAADRLPPDQGPRGSGDGPGSTAAVP